jgi:hypothetical protein
VKTKDGENIMIKAEIEICKVRIELGRKKKEKSRRDSWESDKEGETMRLRRGDIARDTQGETEGK